MSFCPHCDFMNSEQDVYCASCTKPLRNQPIEVERARSTHLPLSNVERNAIVGCCVLSILLFFFPLLTIEFPFAGERNAIVGEQDVRGYDVFSKLPELREKLIGYDAFSKETERLKRNTNRFMYEESLVTREVHEGRKWPPNMPLSIQLRWLTQLAIIMAFVSAAIALVTAFKVIRISRIVCVIGAVCAGAAILHITIMNSDLHSWLESELKRNLFAGLAEEGLLDVLQIKPAWGAYALLVLLGLAAVLGFSRVLSRLGVAPEGSIDSLRVTQLRAAASAQPLGASWFNATSIEKEKKMQPTMKSKFTILQIAVLLGFALAILGFFLSWGSHSFSGHGSFGGRQFSFTATFPHTGRNAWLWGYASLALGIVGVTLTALLLVSLLKRGLTKLRLNWAQVAVGMLGIVLLIAMRFTPKSNWEPSWWRTTQTLPFNEAVWSHEGIALLPLGAGMAFVGFVLAAAASLFAAKSNHTDARDKALAPERESQCFMPDPSDETETMYSEFASKLDCLKCQKTHAVPQWPENGDRVAYYYQAQQGAYGFRTQCPHCKHEWWVVWDQDPGPLVSVD